MFWACRAAICAWVAVICSRVCADAEMGIAAMKKPALIKVPTKLERVKRPRLFPLLISKPWLILSVVIIRLEPFSSPVRCWRNCIPSFAYLTSMPWDWLHLEAVEIVMRFRCPHSLIQDWDRQVSEGGENFRKHAYSSAHDACGPGSYARLCDLFGLPVAAEPNRAKVFSFLNTWSDFLTVAVIPALLSVTQFLRLRWRLCQSRFPAQAARLFSFHRDLGSIVAVDHQ